MKIKLNEEKMKEICGGSIALANIAFALIISSLVILFTRLIITRSTFSSSGGFIFDWFGR
ncbi:MAG TPA: hypothetical protein DCY93_02680 [Firmicutes bacterium]|nr:hypothetical protein [Bacillota bacterium]